jgi:hypothetical protein
MRRRNLAKHFDVVNKATATRSSLERALDDLAKVKTPKKEARIKGTKKTTVYGITFDSKREAEYYLQLRARKEDGEIVEIERQKRYEIIPAQFERIPLKRGKNKFRLKVIERATHYIADFVVHYKNADVEVIDVKGFRTEIYRLKRKLMLLVHGIKITEV